MSQKKLIGTIAACIVATIIVMVIATPGWPPITEPSAEEPRDGSPVPPSPKREYLGLSIDEVVQKLFDKSLTGLQREELWKSYKGKRVRWISELEDVSSTKDGAVATFADRIRVSFDTTETPALLQLKKGDMVIYTGALDSFSYDQYGLASSFQLKSGSIVSLACEEIWSAKVPVEEAIFGAKGGLGAVDSRHVYLWAFDLFRDPDWRVNVTIHTLDRATGNRISTDSLEFTPSEMWDRVLQQESWQQAKREIVSRAGNGVIIVPDQLPLEGRYNELIIKAERGSLKCYDAKGESLLWAKEFPFAFFHSILVYEQMVYVHLHQGVGQPNLLAFRLQDLLID